MYKANYSDCFTIGTWCTIKVLSLTYFKRLFYCFSVELEKRIDFELREGLVESRYWSAVTSHTAYWCSHDVALFLLTFMYKPNDVNDMAEDNLES